MLQLNSIHPSLTILKPFTLTQGIVKTLEHDFINHKDDEIVFSQNKSFFNIQLKNMFTKQIAARPFSNYKTLTPLKTHSIQF